MLASAAVLRQVGGAGAVALSLKVPRYTRAVRAQVDYPLVVGLGWSR